MKRWNFRTIARFAAGNWVEGRGGDMLIIILLVIAWVGVACLGDVFFKNAKTFCDPNFLFGLFCYGITSSLAVLTFRRAEFASVAILWIAISLLLSLLVSEIGRASWRERV